MATITHQKVSAVADGGDPSLVLPSDWNAAHTIVTVATDVVLGRSTAGGGAVEELAFTDAAQQFCDDATFADMRTTLGVPAGSGTSTGTNTGDQTITLTGDTTGSGAGTFATTLATVNSNVGTFGSATQVPQVTVNAKGLVIGVSNVTITNPWTYAVLGSDFVTNSASAAIITGLEFTAAANKTYEFRANLMLRTATTTVGPRPAVAWPGGMTDGVATIRTTSAAGTDVIQNGNISATVLGPVGGLPDTTNSWPSTINGTLKAGASPTSTLRLGLASETGGTNVTAKTGSWLAWREIA